MFEEIDLKVGDEAGESTQYIVTVYCSRGICTRTASGGYGTSCKYCC